MITDYELTNSMKIRFAMRLNEDGLDIVYVLNQIHNPILFDRRTQTFYETSEKDLKQKSAMVGVNFK
ncbi:MAG: hypothetical protein PHW89_08015 [Sulfurimonas denitrificans]|nr:hypothetical protein [Sulfurimonas denitrificans]